MTRHLNTEITDTGISITVPKDARGTDAWEGQEVFVIDYTSCDPKRWHLFKVQEGIGKWLVATFYDREAAEYRALSEYIETRADFLINPDHQESSQPSDCPTDGRSARGEL